MVQAEAATGAIATRGVVFGGSGALSIAVSLTVPRAGRFRLEVGGDGIRVVGVGERHGALNPVDREFTIAERIVSGPMRVLSTENILSDSNQLVDDARQRVKLGELGKDRLGLLWRNPEMLGIGGETRRCGLDPELVRMGAKRFGQVGAVVRQCDPEIGHQPIEPLLLLVEAECRGHWDLAGDHRDSDRVRRSFQHIKVAMSEGSRRALDLLTTVEAAKLLRMSARTLEGMRVSGTGPRYFKVGPGRMAKVVYRPDDLEAWLGRFGFGSTSEY